jgi:hypothetical protein
MQKYIVLIIIILFSTALAQLLSINPTQDFLARCAKGEIAQGFSLACQTVQRNPILYRASETPLDQIYILLPSNDGIEKYLKAKDKTLLEFRKFDSSIAFTQAHVLVGESISTQISVDGNFVMLDLPSNKITVNGIETVLLGKENTPFGYPIFLYVEKPLEFQDAAAKAQSFLFSPVIFQENGIDVRSVSIFAVVDQCARSLIYPEYSLSCQAIQKSGLLLRSQTVHTCFGVRMILLPTNLSLERVLRQKNISTHTFLAWSSAYQFAKTHLGCLPSQEDFINVFSTRYTYVPFGKWTKGMSYTKYRLELSAPLDTSVFVPTSVDAIYSKELNGVAAQIQPYTVQSFYKSYVYSSSNNSFLLLDKPLPF